MKKLAVITPEQWKMVSEAVVNENGLDVLEVDGYHVRDIETNCTILFFTVEGILFLDDSSGFEDFEDAILELLEPSLDDIIKEFDDKYPDAKVTREGWPKLTKSDLKDYQGR